MKVLITSGVIKEITSQFHGKLGKIRSKAICKNECDFQGVNKRVYSMNIINRKSVYSNVYFNENYSSRLWSTITWVCETCLHNCLNKV